MLPAPVCCSHCPKAVLEKRASDASAAVAAALNEHAAANKAPITRKRGGPAATLGKAKKPTKVVNNAPVIDSEADEDSEDGQKNDAGQYVLDSVDGDEPSPMPLVSDDDNEVGEQLEVEHTPKIVRRRPMESSPPSTPKTPSPVKAQKALTTKYKATPGKRAKVSDSEDESDRDISPMKKAKIGSGMSEGKNIGLPLPRRQYIAQQLKAKAKAKAEPATEPAKGQKNNVEVVITTSRKPPVKLATSKSPVKSAKTAKASKAPDSGSSFFSHETDDEEKARRQRRLFEKHLVDSNRTSNLEVYEELEETQPMVLCSDSEDEPKNTEDTATENDLAVTFADKLVSDVEDLDVVNPAMKESYEGLPALHRAICMSLGYVFTCNVVYPTTFGKQQAQMVKSILFGPMRAEWERSMSFFGTVFGAQEMSVNTFSASSQYIGINVRTFPSEPASALPTVDFISATPSKRGKQKERTGTKLVPVPSRSLLDMREKTTWSTNDDEYLKKDKRKTLQFSFDILHTVPRMTADPSFGDRVMVLYSTSAYRREGAGALGLSLNLYRIV
ncbi:hypothetical protein GY45DRAFT_1376147 [Cubamyces sp. BRFM 1775]|nr:hypothetical protein GY45DRAFT_1376147 [Cubamyces sp. BRFM 1775]